MGAATSKFDGHQALGLGLSACVGIGAVIGYMGQREASEGHTADVAAMEAQLRHEASQEQIRALQMELDSARQAQVQFEKAQSDLLLQLEGSQQQAKASQEQIRALQMELDSSRQAQVQFEKAQSDLLVQLEDSQQQAKALQQELQSARQEIEESAMGATFSEAAQRDLVDQIDTLRAEKDMHEESEDHMQRELAATRQQQAEALSAVESLEKEQGHLQEELAASRRKRKTSFSTLEDISKKLDNVSTSWSPWVQLNDIKGHVQGRLAFEDDEVLRGA